VAIPNRLRHAVPLRAAVILLGLVAAGPAPRAAGVIDTPVRASWTRLPLREWADRAAAIAGMPVIVDRRLDHTTPITLDADGEPLAAVLDRVAALAGARVEMLEATIRMVPPEAAGRAAAGEAARQAEFRALPDAERRSLSARQAFTWPAAAEPRQLVERLAAEHGIRLVGLEQIPHDHLPPGNVAPLTVAERIDLLLAHFDLRASWHPGGGRVIPAVDRSRPVAIAAGRPRPGERPQPRDARGQPTIAEERHTLRLEAPLDQAVAAIAHRFSLRPEIDATSLAARGIAPAEIVRVRVADVTRDDLLDAVVAPLGLSWAIDDGVLRVFAAPAADDSR